MNKFLSTTLMLGVLAIFFVPALAELGSFADLTIFNNAGETVLLKYKRSEQEPLLTKLLEYGEQLSFGKVSYALLTNTGTFGSYLAPQDVILFGPQIAPSAQPLLLRINGIKNRGITKPFGEWDVELITSQQLPPLLMPKHDRFLSAFPTVIKKLVPTPRFILGLPEEATVASADEAAQMLTNKWQTIKQNNSNDQVMLKKIVDMIEEARLAFHEGKADEPLRDTVSKGIRELTTD